MHPVFVFKVIKMCAVQSFHPRKELVKEIIKKINKFNFKNKVIYVSYII